MSNIFVILLFERKEMCTNCLISIFFKLREKIGRSLCIVDTIAIEKSELSSVTN